MKGTFVFLLIALPFLACSCKSNRENEAYTPANSFEAAQLPKTTIDIYPDDVRANLNQYTNYVVAWAGIIRETHAEEPDANGLIHATTLLDHHYFDWQESRSKTGHKEYSVSPRGEGLFRVDWTSRGTRRNVGAAETERYAAPGKLAIVYGEPQSVDGDVVVLGYHYIRIIDPKNFNTQTYDYGRVGEPYKYLKK